MADPKAAAEPETSDADSSAEEMGPKTANERAVLRVVTEAGSEGITFANLVKAVGLAGSSTSRSTKRLRSRKLIVRTDDTPSRFRLWTPEDGDSSIPAPRVSRPKPEPQETDDEQPAAPAKGEKVVVDGNTVPADHPVAKAAAKPASAKPATAKQPRKAPPAKASAGK